jgi:hypothetical protein
MCLGGEIFCHIKQMEMKSNKVKIIVKAPDQNITESMQVMLKATVSRTQLMVKIP